MDNPIALEHSLGQRVFFGPSLNDVGFFRHLKTNFLADEVVLQMKILPFDGGLPLLTEGSIEAEVVLIGKTGLLDDSFDEVLLVFAHKEADSAHVLVRSATFEVRVSTHSLMSNDMSSMIV